MGRLVLLGLAGLFLVGCSDNVVKMKSVKPRLNIIQKTACVMRLRTIDCQNWLENGDL